MWESDKLEMLISELLELSKECWCIDKVYESETIDSTIKVLSKQLDMLKGLDGE